MKKVLFIALVLTGSTHVVFSQKPTTDAVLHTVPESPILQQIGSENRILFLHKDKDTNHFNNNLSLRQIGSENTLILSELKNTDARLDIRQEGFGNKLFVEDLRSPLQIRQTGGMELIIRGNNFIQQTIP